MIYLLVCLFAVLGMEPRPCACWVSAWFPAFFPISCWVFVFFVSFETGSHAKLLPLNLLRSWRWLWLPHSPALTFQVTATGFFFVVVVAVFFIGGSNWPKALVSVSYLPFFYPNLEPGSRVIHFLQILGGTGSKGSELEGANMNSGGKGGTDPVASPSLTLWPPDLCPEYRVFEYLCRNTTTSKHTSSKSFKQKKE